VNSNIHPKQRCVCWRSSIKGGTANIDIATGNEGTPKVCRLANIAQWLHRAALREKPPILKLEESFGWFGAGDSPAQTNE